jgi:hypothetical protein
MVIECKDCEQKFSSKDEAQLHTAAKHSHRCPLCPKSKLYPTKTAVNVHICYKHPDYEGPAYNAPKKPDPPPTDSPAAAPAPSQHASMYESIFPNNVQTFR